MNHAVVMSAGASHGINVHKKQFEPPRPINNLQPAQSDPSNSPDVMGAPGGGEEDDDDDFKKNNDYEKMCLDQLLEGASVGGAGYDDNDPLEEDDEVRGDDELGEDPEEDLMIDEEEDDENAGQQQHGERTTKSENLTGMNRKNFSESDNKAFRIQKKQSVTTASTQKKKPGSKSNSKKPACYNEGAEESKGWMADEQVSKPTDPKQPLINPNNYEVEDNLSTGMGPDGKPNKLKDAFLLRPPNN